MPRNIIILQRKLLQTYPTPWKSRGLVIAWPVIALALITFDDSATIRVCCGKQLQYFVIIIFGVLHLSLILSNRQSVAVKTAANSTFKGKVTLLFILIILQQYFLILHISIYNILLKLLNYQYIISSAICKSTMIFLHPFGFFYD